MSLFELFVVNVEFLYAVGQDARGRTENACGFSHIAIGIFEGLDENFAFI